MQLQERIHKAILTAAFVLQLHAAVMEDRVVTAGYYDATVIVSNKLSSEMAVIVHCRSKQHDLGARAVGAGASYSFTFGKNLFGGTLFWCRAAFQDRRLAFLAFKQDDEGNVYVIDFEVSDDGVDRVNGEERVHITGWNRK
ncbi:unnamed protein product [Linum trigynum]